MLNLDKIELVLQLEEVIKESSMNPLQKIVKRLREISQLELLNRLTDRNKHNNIHPTNQVRFTNQNIKNL